MGIFSPEPAAGDGDEGDPEGEGLALLPEDLGDPEGDATGLLLLLLGDGEPEADAGEGLDQVELPAGEPEGDDDEPEDVLLPGDVLLPDDVLSPDDVLLPELPPPTCTCQFISYHRDSSFFSLVLVSHHMPLLGSLQSVSALGLQPAQSQPSYTVPSVMEFCREWLAQIKTPTKRTACCIRSFFTAPGTEILLLTDPSTAGVI